MAAQEFRSKTSSTADGEMLRVVVGEGVPQQRYFCDMEIQNGRVRKARFYFE